MDHLEFFENFDSTQSSENALSFGTTLDEGFNLAKRQKSWDQKSNDKTELGLSTGFWCNSFFDQNQRVEQTAKSQFVLDIEPFYEDTTPGKRTALFAAWHYPSSDPGDRIRIAVKIQPNTQHARQEAMLVELYHRQGSAYAPRFHGSETADGESQFYFGMEKLDQDVFSLQLECGRFTVQTTRRLCVQALKALKDFHALSFVHGDVKPSNLMIADRKSNAETVLRLVDFGLATRFRDGSSNGPVIPRRRIGRLTGTTRYASSAVHLGWEPRIRDDLVSLFYSICEMNAGPLPWESLENREDSATPSAIAEGIYKLKIHPDFALEKIAASLAPSMVRFANFVQNLQDDEQPNYEFLEHCLNEWKGTEKQERTRNYDWHCSPQKHNYLSL